MVGWYTLITDKWHQKSYLKTTCMPGVLVGRCIEELKISMIPSVFIIQFDGKAWTKIGEVGPRNQKRRGGSLVNWMLPIIPKFWNTVPKKLPFTEQRKTNNFKIHAGSRHFSLNRSKSWKRGAMLSMDALHGPAAQWQFGIWAQYGSIDRLMARF